VTTIEKVLRQAADLFHEVGSAIAADDLIADCRNVKLAEALRANRRSHDQLKKLVTDGFKLSTAEFDETPQLLAMAIATSEEPLHKCANHFFALLMALADKDYLTRRVYIRMVSADGFELCVRALARMGAKDVSIHECSEQSMEEHW
jgi:hypothetical protein